MQGLVNKRTTKIWLQYLINTPLYVAYNITIDENFLNNNNEQKLVLHKVSEVIPIEESLMAQQQTLMWNDEIFLHITP